MTSALNRLPDGTIELTITIPWEEVVKTREEVVSSLAKTAELPGFRKGKAPKKLLEQKLDQEKVREEILKILLPKAVNESVTQHKIRPILSPQIAMKKIDEGTDWEFVARTCESPDVDLDNYKDAVKNVTAKSKIIVPGKTPSKPSLDDIIKAILESVKVTVPSLLIENEVNHLLSQMIDEIKRLGLSLDQYLSSTGKTTEQVRSDYEKKAGNDITFELALQKIADEESIQVEKKEIDEAILKAKTDEERKNLETNRYLLARILRQQKTLDFLTKL